MELFEIAPGVDLHRDVLDQMQFKPLLAARIAVMPAAFFHAHDDGTGALSNRA